MTTPVVSVVIPCYQHGHWLGGALASVFAQSVPGIEAIVVNDGSTDDTADVARDWQLRRPGRVCVLDTPRVGQARARRAGLARAAGGFYVTLDADDLLEPGMAEAGLAALARDPAAAAAAGDVWMTDETGRRALMRLSQGVLPPWPRVLEANPFGACHGLLIRAAAAAKVGGVALDGLPGGEDWDFYVRLVRARMTTVKAPGIMGRYRQSSASFSRRARANLEAHAEILERCLRPDPRLEVGIGQPVLTGAERDAYLNRYLFFGLGVAAVTGAEEAGAMLDLYRPGVGAPEALAREFARGVSHGRLMKGFLTTGLVEAIHPALESALIRAGDGIRTPVLERAMRVALGRQAFFGPRYWIRRLEAWRATRRFRRKEISDFRFKMEKA
jgi:glycosyltransferase involved in cell wall biosynthesis